MGEFKKERLENSFLGRLEAILGKKDYAAYTHASNSQERYQLFITKNPKGGFVVEFIEPGNIHNNFFVDESGVKTERKRLLFVPKNHYDKSDEAAKMDDKEEVEQDISLGAVLEKFGL